MKAVPAQVSPSVVPQGYRSYRIKGLDKTIIARKGGPSKEQIKSNPNYETLRSNQKEFAVASMMSKVLRDSLSPGMSEICESYVSGRLTAQFRNLAKLEQGETGTRPMTLSKHGHLLNGFEFNTHSPYEEIFGTKYFVKPGSRKGQVILHFPAFVPDETFTKPEEATNFKIKARLVALSDYSYNEEDGAYCAENKELHGQYGDYETTMLPLLKIPTEPMTAMVGINHPDIPEDTACFLVMAISFYKYVGGKFLHLNKHSGMTIKRVY